MNDDQKNTGNSASGTGTGLPRLKNPMELLKESFRVWSYRPTTYLGVYLLAFVAVIVILLPFFFLFHAFSSPEGGVAKNAEIVLPFLTGFLALAAFYWAYVAILHTVVLDENPGIVHSFKRSVKKILPLLWLSILAGFITIGGYVLFVVPGIILAVWFVFVPYVLMSEDTRGMKALMRSREYVRGYWWPVFGRMLLLMFVISLPQIVLMLVSYLFSVQDTVSTKVLFDILDIIIPLLLTPFALVYMFLLYKNIREVKNLPEVKSSKKQKTFYAILGTIGVLITLIGLLLAAALASLNAAHDIKDSEMKTLPRQENFDAYPPVAFTSSHEV